MDDTVNVWACCRRSAVCILDNLAHRLRLTIRPLCDAHDRRIRG